VRRQACSNRLGTPFRNGVARIFENADQSLARLWQDHSNGLGTARPVSGSLTLLVPYPVPRCASSGKGHSHAATVELTLSCSPSWGDPEKPVSRRPLTGAQVTGDTPPDERMSGQRAAPLLSLQYVIPGQDPQTSYRTDPQGTPADDGAACPRPCAGTQAGPLHFPATHGHLRP